jgi:hypothetical protein
MQLLPRRLLPIVTLLLALAAGPLARAQVFISEFVADNQLGTLVDAEGNHSDWLELWNSGASAVNLNGWYLTDNSSDLRAWQFPVTTPAVNIAAGGRLVIFCSGMERKLDAAKLHTNFKLSKSAGSYLALVRPDGLTVEHAYNGYPQQVQDIAYGLVAQTQWQTLIAPGADGKAKVPLSAADMPVGWNTASFDDSSWQSGQTGFGYDTLNGYGSLLGAGGDLQVSMYNVNSCALVRIVFNVANPGAIAALRLSMKYDDGFNCYLNGTSIQTSLSNGTAWNAGAILDRNDAQTASYQIFTPTNAQNFLVAGTNVLAFQLLNNTNGSTADADSQGVPNGSRALCLPFLEGNFITGTGTANYLTSATPGAANSAARTNIGPGISKTTDQPPRPTGIAGSAPIIVTAKVIPTLRPLATTNPVNLRYRINFAAETTVVMRDNGVAPDAVAGDSIFTAQIPTTTAGIGQMIRWKVIATDNTNISSTNPPYLDPTDNDQYYGTVTQDNIVTSLLPVLHWFVQDTASSDTDGGTRCSLFYLGRFYDNVFVGLHGQSSSGFPVKKSHDFNFSEDNRFTWQEGQGQQRAVNLITTYADKSRIRDTMAWESWALTGHIASHWAKVTRVQQNGAFWGIYDMVENGDEDFPARAGLDQQGALYKIYNSLESTAGAEKKSRDFEGTTDLQALIDGVDTAKSISARRQYSYDNVDVPSLVNYLATNVIILNNDFGHKNYYVYRDTNGTREWSVLPWDQDLSLGHTWTGTQNYFNDDIHSQAGLVIGAAPGNRLMNLIMNSNTSTIAPEMAQMFLRRMRSLMDKLLVSATATNGPLDQRIIQLIDQVDPPGAAYLTDADLDLQKWGYWVDGDATQVSPNNNFDAATHQHGARKQAMRLLNSNPSPPNPAAANNAEGLGNTLPAFLTGRRSLLFTTNPTLNGLPIPASQTAVPANLVIERVEFNPASGNQDHEYFIIRNNSTSYVDVSGWKITGAVDYTFRGGTVIPPFTSNSVYNATGDVHAGRLHVARNPGQFRLRTVSPKGNEFRLVVGGYSGQLSARGETINLVIPGASVAQDVVVATNTYVGAPTAAQNFLRVTELNYNPAAPTVAESAALPAVQASDFEFIELTNTGAAALNLGGCRFDKGVSFTFPAGFTLQGGARCVIVSLISAYNLRYGSAGATVAGQFEGNLSNSGETLQIIDTVGESVLQFTYDPLWFGVPDPAAPGSLKAMQGYSFVSPSTAPAWNGYDTPTTWALSGAPGGTPGTNDLVFSNVFTGWANAYFTTAELANAAVGGPNADPDLDGRTNFEEFCYGGNPRAFENKPLPTASVVMVDETNYLAITFDRRRNALDTTFVVQAASDLGAWAPVDLPVGTVTDLGNGMERVTYRDSQASGNGQRFLRVRATR